MGLGSWAGGGQCGAVFPTAPHFFLLYPTLVPSPDSPACALTVRCATQQLSALSHAGGGSKMRWKNRPLFIFAKTPRYAKHQGPFAYSRDLKKRWWGESALIASQGFCDGVEELGFLSGEVPGEAKLLSCRTLWPINTFLSFLICDLDSEPGAAVAV